MGTGGGGLHLLECSLSKLAPLHSHVSASQLLAANTRKLSLLEAIVYLRIPLAFLENHYSNLLQRCPTQILFYFTIPCFRTGVNFQRTHCHL